MPRVSMCPPSWQMHMDYHWTLAVPSDKLHVHLENHVDARQVV